MSVHRERLLSASVQNPLSPRWRRWSSIPAVAVASVLSASTPAHAADGQYIANNTPAFVAAAKSLGAAAESQRIEVSLWLKPHNRAAMDALAQQLYDRS